MYAPKTLHIPLSFEQLGISHPVKVKIAIVCYEYTNYFNYAFNNIFKKITFKDI